MKREQLTNVETESIDQRCHELARQGLHYCSRVTELRAAFTAMNYKGGNRRVGFNIDYAIDYADRIISLRSQQVTP